MGNKSNGRAFMNLPYEKYLTQMGGTIDSSTQNSGISFSNSQIVKYFKILSNYAMNRYVWKSDSISSKELRLIEYNIFHHGYCAMLRPVFRRNGVKIKDTELKIFPCTFSEINFRTGEPRRITLMNNSFNSDIVPIYKEDDFVIFTDYFAFTMKAIPFWFTAWEFANKLYELDLAFNANSHKQRMPFIFNNGAVNRKNLKYGSQKNAGQYNIDNGISVILRSAFETNEQFVEIPSYMFGDDNFLHTPLVNSNLLAEHIETQRKIYMAYFDLLGLYTNKEKSGVYTNLLQQGEGDETPNFVEKANRSRRYTSMEEAVSKFKISMSIETI